MSQQFYIRVRGKIQGPFDRERLQGMARRGQFSRLHEVSTDGVIWDRASNHPDLFTGLSVVPQGAATPEATPAAKPTAIARRDTNEYALAEPVPDEFDDGDAPPTSPREQRWYYSVGSTQQGPVAFSMLQVLVSTGQLAPDDLVWCDGMAEWTTVGRVPGLVRPAAPAPASAVVAAASPATTAVPQVSGLAIASLVLGILGLLPLFGIGSLMAVIFGHVALSIIHRSNGTRTGGGMAVAGLVLGYLVMGPIIGYLLFLLVLVIIGAITAGAGSLLV
jgi:hypothetical protein